jgi:hypothetical protein
VKQIVNRAASGDQGATQFVFSLLADDAGKPPPPPSRETPFGDGGRGAKKGIAIASS